MSVSFKIIPKIPAAAVIRYTLSAVIAVILPVFLFYSQSTWLGYSYDPSSALFEYFGFSTSLILILNLIYERLARRNSPSINPPWIKIGFIILAFGYLIFFSEYSKVGWDYSAYENAVRQVLSGSSPYQSYPPYIYPPLLVQLLFFIFKSIRWLAVNIFSLQLSNDELFFLLFYFYQCLQYAIFLVCFYLSFLFARKLGMSEKNATLLCGVIFLVNTPLLRNFRMGQINLQILVPILLLLLWTDRFPILSGLSIAYGAHLKIYPVLFMLPWLISKKWKPIAASILAGLLILLVQTNWFRDFQLYDHFFGYFKNVERGTALRNNSISSLALNLSKLLTNHNSSYGEALTTILVVGFTVLAVAWMGYRFYIRRKSGLPSEQLLIANSIDTIALMFFLSPSVWDHHLVMAIPLVIFAVAAHPEKVWGSVGLGALCLFFIPTFDVFFFSYIRLFGLIVLMSAISPAKVNNNPPTPPIEPPQPQPGG